MFTMLLVGAMTVGAYVAYRRLPTTSPVRRAVTAAADVSAHLYPKGPASIAGLQRRVLRRMYQSVTIGVSGTVMVPTDFCVTLAADDFDIVEPMRTWFVAELVDALTTEANRAGWSCAHRVNVTLVPSYDQPSGVPKVAGFFNPTTESAAATAPPTIDGPTELADDHATLLADGATYLVTNGTVAGRAHDAAIVIADPTASRHHCRFGRSHDGWFIEDLGSMNGTSVNGTKISSVRTLADGDILQLTSTFQAQFATASAASRPVGAVTAAG